MKTNSAMPVELTHLKSSCSHCGLRKLCLPIGLSAGELKRLDQLVYARRKVRRGEDLYRAGSVFSAIYAIRSGSFKNDLVLQDGREQVMGLHMPGEILGMDGIGAELYTCNAVALEDSDVCVIPFCRLEEISHYVPSLQHQFLRVMGREMMRHQEAKMLLGGARAEMRVAAFLLNLSQRFEARGCSGSEFNLRMTREDIGSLLGLTLETVSRVFSQLRRGKLLAVLQKDVRILDAAGLRKIAGATDAPKPIVAAAAPLSGRPPPVHGKPRRAVPNALALCA